MTALAIIVAAVLVAFAWTWREAYCKGRRDQRAVSVLNPGEAIMFDVGAMRAMVTPGDWQALKPKRDHRAEDRADAMEYAFRARARFDAGYNAHAAIKLTGMNP